MKTIIFDVDGVIFKTHDIDGRYLWSRSIKQDFGLSKRHFQKIFCLEWDDIVRGKLDTISHLQKVFHDQIFQNLKISPEKFINYWLENDNNINLDVLDLIKTLEVPCYLGTNQEKYRTNHILKLVGNYFNGCFSSYQIGYKKPELNFFDHIEKTLSLSATDLLLVDDTLENIKAAQAKGWRTYLYQDNVEHLQEFIANLL